MVMKPIFASTTLPSQANTGAVKLMVPFYCQGVPKETINVYDFMESYEVPNYLDNVVREEVHNYYISNRY